MSVRNAAGGPTVPPRMMGCASSQRSARVCPGRTDQSSTSAWTARPCRDVRSRPLGRLLCVWLGQGPTYSVFLNTPYLCGSNVFSIRPNTPVLTVKGPGGGTAKNDMQPSVACNYHMTSIPPRHIRRSSHTTSQRCAVQPSGAASLRTAWPFRRPVQVHPHSWHLPD